MAAEDWLFENIDYVNGSSNELTAADETYRNRAGACRDFAHLGITFCCEHPLNHVSILPVFGSLRPRPSLFPPSSSASIGGS